MSEKDGVLPTVFEDRERNRFVVDQDGQEAELVYEIDGGRVVLVHTGVPETMEGRGIGGALVRAAVDRAKAEHLVVIPLCPFARRWIHMHPEETASVDVDWAS